MTDRINGRANRERDLRGSRRRRFRRTRDDITPSKALELIDRVLEGYGLDPEKSTDKQGWRHLRLGSAEGAAGVVQWKSDEPYLVVFSPVIDLPSDSNQLREVYRLLLELNHEETRSAHFGISNDTILLAVARPIRGLDEVEVDDAFKSVLRLADHYDDILQEILGDLPPAMPKLPEIRMNPEEARMLGALLAYADDHGQSILRTLLEEWQGKGHMVHPTRIGIDLKTRIGERDYSLALIVPGSSEGAAKIILSWQGLYGKYVFPAEAIEQFQSKISELTELAFTEVSAHLLVGEGFSDVDALTLAGAMDRLAKSGDSQLDPEVSFTWDLDVPDMDIRVSKKTLHRIQETLRMCEPRVQEMYTHLIRGWSAAAGTVECRRVGRIYLKLHSAEHEHGKYGVVSHRFNLAVLAAPKGDSAPIVDIQWDLGHGNYAYLDYIAEAVDEFEKAVAALPGFTQERTMTRLVIGEAFESDHADVLLKALTNLKKAATATE